MNDEIKSTLLLLETAATHMHAAGEAMCQLESKHPEIAEHGREMVGAADVAQTWLARIVAENSGAD